MLRELPTTETLRSSSARRHSEAGTDARSSRFVSFGFGLEGAEQRNQLKYL
jgi:hypothetical protein